MNTNRKAVRLFVPRGCVATAQAATDRGSNLLLICMDDQSNTGSDTGFGRDRDGQADPNELHNLALRPHQRDRVIAMCEQLIAGMRKVVAGMVDRLPAVADLGAIVAADVFQHAEAN